jgi:signal transduction histidine kinase
MSDLRPSTELGRPLVDALRRRTETFAGRSGIPVRFIDAGGTDHEPPMAAKHELLRILGEALVNASRHGHATAITVSLNGGPGEVCLSVSDNGEGLGQPVDVERLKAEGHFGLAGMHERARAIGGVLEVQPAPDGGTVVTVRLPLADPRPPDDREPGAVRRLVPRVRLLGSRRAGRSEVGA